MHQLALSIESLFGKDASQNIDSIIIKKNNLPGLTSSPSNTAESILVALILKIIENFEGNLTDNQGFSLTDNLGNKVTFSNRELYELLEGFFWKRDFTRRNDSLFSRISFVIMSYTPDDGN